MVRLPYVLVIPVAEGRKTVWAGADLNGIARSLFERHLRAGEKALARGRSSVALRYAEEVLEGMKTTKRAHAHLERAAVELQRRARKVLGVRLHDLAPDR